MKYSYVEHLTLFYLRLNCLKQNLSQAYDINTDCAVGVGKFNNIAAEEKFVTQLNRFAILIPIYMYDFIESC